MVEQLLISNIMSCHLKPDGRYIAAAENMPENVKLLRHHMSKPTNHSYKPYSIPVDLLFAQSQV